MGKVLNKVLKFLGFEVKEEIKDEDEAENKKIQASKNIVGLPSHKSKIVIIRPVSFDDNVQIIADSLKQRRPVILNIEESGSELGRRVLDFTGGAVYSLEGSLTRIDHNNFLVCPAGIDVIGDGDRDRDDHFQNY